MAIYKEQARELAEALDAVEAELRGLERRIYYVRCALEKVVGKPVGFHERPAAEEAREGR